MALFSDILLTVYFDRTLTASATAPSRKNFPMSVPVQKVLLRM